MKPTGEVHPAAAAFPMLPDDELAALAESIAADGLLEPIVLTPEGMLLDGRNRMAACKKAKVAPSFVVYEGDPVAFVLARNNQRRHMTKGARAMAGYMAAVQSVDKPTVRELGALIGTGKSTVGMAQVVAEFAPHLVPLVISGATALKPAYDVAAENRKQSEDDQARHDKLRGQYPDLAAQVTEETLTLGEALAAAKAREAERVAAEQSEKAALEGFIATLTRVVLHGGGFQRSEQVDHFIDRCRYFDLPLPTYEDLDGAFSKIAAAAKKWSK